MKLVANPQWTNPDELRWWNDRETVHEFVARAAKAGFYDKDIARVIRCSASHVGNLRNHQGVPPGSQVRQLATVHPKVAERRRAADRFGDKAVALHLDGHDVDGVAAALRIARQWAQWILGARGYAYKWRGGQWVPVPGAEPPDPDWRDPKSAPIGRAKEAALVLKAARAWVAAECDDCGRGDVAAQVVLRTGAPFERLRLDPRDAGLYSTDPADYQSQCWACRQRVMDTGPTHCSRGHRRAGHPTPCPPCLVMRRFERLLERSNPGRLGDHKG